MMEWVGASVHTRVIAEIIHDTEDEPFEDFVKRVEAAGYEILEIREGSVVVGDTDQGPMTMKKDD